MNTCLLSVRMDPAAPDAPATGDTALAALALRLGVPQGAHGTYQVARDEHGLCVLLPAPMKPLRVDFDRAEVHRRMARATPAQELLLRAVDWRRDAPPQVLDATGGLGLDSWLLASSGCQVDVCERSPLVHALLEDGLLRAGDRRVAARITLRAMDAQLWLADAAPVPVVYLDPMFADPGKRARSAKGMQVLQQLVGADQDAAALLPLARQRATRRVVVKRSDKAPFLGGAVPAFQYQGKSVRYDVYLPQLAGP